MNFRMNHILEYYLAIHINKKHKGLSLYLVYFNQRYIFEGESVYIVSIIDNTKKIIGEPYLHASKTKESNFLIFWKFYF